MSATPPLVTLSDEATARSTSLGTLSGKNFRSSVMIYYIITIEAMIYLTPLLSPSRTGKYRSPASTVKRALTLSKEFTGSAYCTAFISVANAVSAAAGCPRDTSHPLVWSTLTNVVAFLLAYKAILVNLCKLSPEDALIHAERVFGKVAFLPTSVPENMDILPDVALALDAFLIKCSNNKSGNMIGLQHPVIDFNKIVIAQRMFRFLLMQDKIDAVTCLLLPASTWAIMERATRSSNALARTLLRKTFVRRFLREYHVSLHPDGSVERITMRHWPEENFINDGDRSNPKRRRRLPPGQTCTASGTEDIMYSIEHPAVTDTVLIPGQFISSRAAIPDSSDILGSIDLGLFVPLTNTTSTDTADLGDDDDSESDETHTGNVMITLNFSSDDDTGFTTDNSSE